MNYATWKLNFADPQYGTGPEQTIADQGFRADAGWSDGQVETGATIQGYVFGDADATALSDWEFAYITQAEALAFSQAINPKAYFLPDGKIAAPNEEPEI